MNAPQMPLISVVIPCYNVAKYIQGCLDSVLAQTFKSFEVICVIDGSPDNTAELIRFYSDERIRVIHQKNRGLAGARNTGINASRGIYVALLDADDLWLPTKLEAHFKHLQMNPKVGISYSASEFIDEAGNRMGIGQYPKTKDVSAKDIFCRNPIGNGSAPVIRKSLLNKIARPEHKHGVSYFSYFDEDMRQSEDVEFWLRAVLKTEFKIEGIPQALTLYRVNMSGLSANLHKQYESWLYSVEQNASINPEFIRTWFKLAAAYQKRYLARRAVQARQSTTALKLMWEAFRLDIRVLTEEPKRTIVTLGCAVLCALPERIYSAMETVAMNAQRKSLPGA